MHVHAQHVCEQDTTAQASTSDWGDPDAQANTSGWGDTTGNDGNAWGSSDANDASDWDKFLKKDEPMNERVEEIAAPDDTARADSHATDDRPGESAWEKPASPAATRQSFAMAASPTENAVVGLMSPWSGPSKKTTEPDYSFAEPSAAVSRDVVVKAPAHEDWQPMFDFADLALSDAGEASPTAVKRNDNIKAWMRWVKF